MEIQQATLVLYTVQRIRVDDECYGKVHGSADGEKTSCGHQLNSSWYIRTNAFDGVVECKQCVAAILEERNDLLSLAKKTKNQKGGRR
jgi:hypothetical protein